MPKTKDAFALRDFDAERILSRNFFDDVFFKKDEALIFGKDKAIEFLNLSRAKDARILFFFEFRRIEFNSSVLLQQQLLQEIKNFVASYRSKISRHCQRIENFKDKLAVKILDSDYLEIDSEKLRTYYVKAKNLVRRYLVFGDDVEELQKKIENLIKLNDLEIERSFRWTFARKIKAARITAGFTQQHLADAAGLTKTDVSRFENGNKLPALLTLVKLSTALNIKTDDLIFGT